MGCSWRIYVGAYADGELEPGRRSEVEEHLRFCEECRRELESIERLRGLCSALEPPEVPLEGDWRRCLEGAFRRRRAHLVAGWLRVAMAWGCGVAAAVVLVLVVLLGVSGEPESGPRLAILAYSDDYVPLHLEEETATVIRLVETGGGEALSPSPPLEILDYGGGYLPVHVVQDNATVIRLVEEGKMEGR